MSSTAIDIDSVKRRYAEDLKAAREREHLTQQEAALAAGVKYRSWQGWEGEETLPDQANSLAVEKRFGVRPTPSYRSQSDAGRQPPDLHLVERAPLSPAASGALSSVAPAKVLGPRSVASQPIARPSAVARVTSKVPSSIRRDRDASPSGRRQR